MSPASFELHNSLSQNLQLHNMSGCKWWTAAAILVANAYNESTNKSFEFGVRLNEETKGKNDDNHNTKVLILNNDNNNINEQS